MLSNRIAWKRGCKRMKRDDRKVDTFDRTFMGQPGCMLTLIAIIILGSLVVTLFHKIF